MVKLKQYHYPKMIHKFEIKIELEFINDNSIPQNLLDKIILFLKQNGFVTYYKKFIIQATNLFKSFPRVIIDLKLYNVSFYNIETLKQGPNFFNCEKLEDIIIENLAKEGYSPKIKIDLSQIIEDSNNELITSNPIDKGLNEKIIDHFHLIIPNKSGNGSTSIFDIGGPNEHYHEIYEFEVGSPIYKGKEQLGNHKHSLPKFIEGFYDSSSMFYGENETIKEHKHLNIYIDIFGNGYIEDKTHFHRIYNGIIYPASDNIQGHTHRIIWNIK